MGIRTHAAGLIHMRTEAKSPHPQGGIPRRTILQGALGIAGAFAIGCMDEKRDTRTYGPHVVALKSDTAAVLEGPEASVFQVKRSVALPLLDTPPGLAAVTPYPRGVWFTPEQFRVQVSYLVSNLEDRSVSLEVLLDAWNEFVWYSPQVRVVDDEIVPDRSCAQRPMILPPRGRVEGRVSFDDFERIAAALAGIMNKAPNPGHLFDPTTNLYESPLAKPYVPTIISGITGFDISIRAAAAARVVVEAMVEIIDLRGVLMDEGDEGSTSNRRPGDRGRRELIPITVVEEG